MRATKKRQKLSGSRNAWIWFLLPSGIGVLIFVCLPFLDVVRRSFLTVVTQEWVGFHNYGLVFKNQAFLLAVKNTLRFTVVCLPVLIGLGLFLAVHLSRLQKIQFLKSCFLFPMAMPAAAIVLVWRMVFSRQGFLNLLLSSLHLIPESGAVDYMSTEAAFWVLVFSYVWKNLGYTVVLWLAGIFSIPTDILDAARVDGASERQCFWQVVFPNLKGTLYTITVLSFLNSFKVFREAYLISGSYPHESIYMLQHLFNNWFTRLDIDKMCAGAVLMALVVMALIGFLQMIWGRGEGK